MNESLMRHTSKFHFSPSFIPSISCSPLLPFFSSIEASSPSFLSKAHSCWQSFFFQGLFPSGDASSHLFSFIFCCISMVENHHWRTSLKLKDPAFIKASQANFHHLRPFIYAHDLSVATYCRVRPAWLPGGGIWCYFQAFSIALSGLLFYFPWQSWSLSSNWGISSWDDGFDLL